MHLRNRVWLGAHQRVEEIHAAERESIYGYLPHLGAPAGRAQKLTQDSFLKLFLKLDRGEEIENPRAWLYRVAHNFTLRFHEREPVFDELTPGVPLSEARPDPERALIVQQRSEALAQAIGALSPQQRNCLHLRASGLRYREIADTIGISTSAVGEFRRRAVHRLKEGLLNV